MIGLLRFVLGILALQNDWTERKYALGDKAGPVLFHCPRNFMPMPNGWHRSSNCCRGNAATVSNFVIQAGTRHRHSDCYPIKTSRFAFRIITTYRPLEANRRFRLHQGPRPRWPLQGTLSTGRARLLEPANPLLEEAGLRRLHVFR